MAYEMVQDPMDFFIRRTGRLYFDIDSVRQFMEPVLQEFQAVYKVDDAQILQWKETLMTALKEHSDFSMERV
ncbi:glycerol-3-phosphate dehydrogenase C-terminal domain-containing protein [Maribacter sp. R77961]|uniref:glycerol-3-phosphate dehydrogenase C-terminal domain-containing protein n=1 Tax=Maribacter sp. R77961 TaxID=3093871 RepID=UPI0037C633CD